MSCATTSEGVVSGQLISTRSPARGGLCGLGRAAVDPDAALGKQALDFSAGTGLVPALEKAVEPLTGQRLFHGENVEFGHVQLATRPAVSDLGRSVKNRAMPATRIKKLVDCPGVNIPAAGREMKS